MSVADSETEQLAPQRRRVPAGQLKFDKGHDFQRELKRRVDGYFQATGLSPRDCPQMYRKTAVILLWLAASYGLLVWGVSAWWLALPLSVSLGLAMAAVGFSIQHDGGHHAYSSRAWVNRLMALTLDLLGGSSYAWARKHNTIHHSYANITGHDNDINIGFFGRLTPHDRWRWIHRAQHVYLWALYGFLPTKWQVYDDFRDVLSKRIGPHPIERPTGWDLAVFLGGKLSFFVMAFAVPLCFQPWWFVLGCYAVASFVQGVALSVVFQLAHCVEEAEFPMPDAETDRMTSAWAEHQVQTSVNFSRESRLVSWFVGGLNFQIEHHLFPQVCHVHYTALAPLVEATCQEFGLRYTVHKSFLSGVKSHYRWLKRMGNAESAAA